MFLLLIRLHLHADECGNGAHVVALGWTHRDPELQGISTGKSGRIHIHVEVGYKRAGRLWECAAKYCEPSSPFSSPVTERNRIERFGFAAESFMALAISMKRCVTGSIVHRAVVDAVAVDGLANAEMVKVGTSMRTYSS